MPNLHNEGPAQIMWTSLIGFAYAKIEIVMRWLMAVRKQSSQLALLSTSVQAGSLLF